MTAKTILEEGNRNEEFTRRLTQTMGNITGSGIYATGASFGGNYLTGVILSTQGSHPPISFLGMKSETGYCNDSDTVFKLALRQVTAPFVENGSSYVLSSSGNSVYS